MQRAFALSIIKVYADYLSKHETESALNKPFFFFIDEPEVSLHPRAQETLAYALREISKHQQVFLTTHSPHFLKHFGVVDNLVYVVSKTAGVVTIQPSNMMSTFSFSPTLAEINYFAYNLATEDFHNELYGFIAEKSQNFRSDKFDQYLSSDHSIPSSKQWIAVKNGQVQSPLSVSLMTYIRHSIHHPENRNNPAYTEIELKDSIEKMLQIVQSASFQVTP